MIPNDPRACTMCSERPTPPARDETAPEIAPCTKTLKCVGYVFGASNATDILQRTAEMRSTALSLVDRKREELADLQKRAGVLETELTNLQAAAEVLRRRMLVMLESVAKTP